MLYDIGKFYNEPSFEEGDFDDAIDNLGTLYNMGEKVSDLLPDLKDDIIDNFNIYDKNEYIQIFINDVKREYRS